MTEQSVAAAELHQLLELTAEQHRIKRRIDLIRNRVDQRAHTEFEETGVAPTWKLPKLGQIRLDGINPEPVAYVVDEKEFAEFVAQAYPTEVVATITLKSVEQLDDALQALEFAGVVASKADVETRPTAVDSILGGCALEEQHDGTGEGHRWLAFDPKDGQQIPGAAGRISSSPRLVVAVDPKLKTAVSEQADLEDHDLVAELEDVTEEVAS